jgi:hypothetical protein
VSLGGGYILEKSSPVNRHAIWDNIDVWSRRKPDSLEVREYWPAFVDRPIESQRITKIGAIWELGTIDWLVKKVGEGQVLLVHDDYVHVLSPCGKHFVLATIVR